MSAIQPKTLRILIVLTLLTGVLVGVVAGVGGYTFYYARGASYMTNDPTACANCHVMQDHYDAWAKSSHHNVAVCNDCHAPHDFIGKYATKAINGWNHSLAFTTGNFHEPIAITDMNRRITENQCRHCHQPVVDAIDPAPLDGHAHAGDWVSLSCIRCHSDVGHPK